MKKKGIFIFFLGLVLILSNACSDSKGPVVLTLSVISASQDLKDLIEDFQGIYPNISVQIREYPMPADDGSYDKYVKAVNTEIFSHNAADIISVQGLPYEEYVKKGVLLKLDGFLDKQKYNNDHYLMNIIDGCRMDGSLYIMPKSFSASIFAIDREAYSSAVPSGFDPYRLTWDDFMTLCRTLYKGNNKPFVTQTVPIPVNLMLMRSTYQDFINFYQKTADFSDEAFLKILEQAKELNASYIDQKISDIMIFSRWNMQGLKILPLTIRHVNDFINLKAAYNNKYAFFMPPMASKQSGNYYDLLEVFGISSKTKHPKEAWLFIDYLLSDESQQNALGLPVNRRVLNTQIDYLCGIDKDFIIPLKKDVPISLSKLKPGEYISVDGFCNEEKEAVIKLFNSLSRLIVYNHSIDNVIMEEVNKFLTEEITARDAINAIEERVSIYLGE